MKKGYLAGIIIYLAAWLPLPGADFFDIPHVAADTWKTTITIYNLGDGTETITLKHWDQDGQMTGSVQHDVPSHGNTELLSSGFGFNGIARVESSEDATIKVKISYLFLKENTESLCEFFVSKNMQANQWFLPNPYQSHFDWFGIAFANHGEVAANLTLTAYKNSSIAGEASIIVQPKMKEVGISSSIWSGLNYADIDYVMVESSEPLSAPISITGNNEQDRHLFFAASTVPTAGSVIRYEIPHIPGGNWHTTLKAYNPMGEHAAFHLVGIDSQGNEVSSNTYGVNPFRVTEFTTEHHLPQGGMATIKAFQPLVFTLSYRFSNSESLCEFILKPDISRQWIVPNTINNWFDWFGLALANFHDSSIQINLTAYKNGHEVSQEDITVNPGQKKVDLSNNLWSDVPMGYDDVDLVVINSDMPIPNPIAITGNTDQTRHVFFQGQNLSEFVSIPDANFKAFLVDAYDSNNDGEISYAEAAVAERIDTPGKSGAVGNFTNLEGLQYFVNLYSLNANYENIESIPNISSLKKLQLLYISYNPIAMLPELKELDALRSLNVSKTKITTLAGLPSSIERIEASGAELTTVDLSGLEHLESFHSTSNPLESINSAGLTSLKNFQVDYCALTSLDLTGCSALSYVQLNENDLTSLTVTGCSEIQTLSATRNNLRDVIDLKDCGKIQALYLTQNAVATLDVTPFPELRILRCAYNALEALDLSACPAISYLDVGHNHISLLDVSNMDNLEDIGTADNDLSQLDLAGKTSLRKVDVRGNQLTVLDLTGCASLTTIYCMDNLLENIPDVSGFSSMDRYSCHGNYFGPDDCAVIQAIEAMELTQFTYNKQADGSTLECP